MTLALVLHDLGVPDGGASWRDALPDAAWEVLDQPGHGRAPAPRSGSYDPMAVTTLARWRVAHHGVTGSLVAGMGANAHAAAVLAAGGGCGALVLVDGLWGPWPDAEAAVAITYGVVQSTLADADAIAPPPEGAVDPRTGHGYGVVATPRLVQPLWACIDVPTLLVETPSSPTPAAERRERASWFGGPTTVVHVDTDAPTAVLEAIVRWWDR